MRQNLAFLWVKQHIKVVFIALLIVAISGSIYSQKAWSLRDCIDYALENNLQIKKSEVSYSIEEANLLQSKLNLLPDLNASSSYSIGFGRSDVENQFTNETTKQSYFSVNTSIDLFRGFTKYNTIKQNQYNHMASKYDSDKMRDDISLMLGQNYLNVLFSMELVEKSKAQLEVTEQQIRNTQKFVDAGTLAVGSLLEIQAQGASEEVALINAENQLNMAYLDLMQLLELAATEDFKVEIPNLIITKEPDILPSEQIYLFSLSNLPQIKSAEMRLKSAEKGLVIARGYRSPSLSASYGWSTYYLNPKYEWFPDGTDGAQIPFSEQFNDNKNRSLRFSLNIPIFNGFQTSSNISRSKLNMLTTEYDLQLVKNTVRKSIEQAYSDAIAAYKTYNANIKSVTSFKEAFKYMEQKFNVGLENSVNYNLAKMQLSSAESDLIAAKYDYIFKTKILDFYMGNPITLDDN
ncbi:MAG: TolC family protein [Bacteroidetes bacterium]|nr:TolC family protein [Bacteroidota bacterium]